MQIGNYLIQEVTPYDRLDDFAHSIQATIRRGGTSYMHVTTQDGAKRIGTYWGSIFVDEEWKSDPPSPCGYSFKNDYGEVYARYDTLTQVAEVVETIKAAISRGDDEFSFPAVAGLTSTRQNTLTKQDIRRAYTEAIIDLLAKGYFIFPDTMSGTQGEIAKVDLSNGSEVIRVFLDHSYDDDTFASQIVLIVGKAPDRTYEHIGVIWSNKVEVLTKRIFQKVDKRHEEYIEL